MPGEVWGMASDGVAMPGGVWGMASRWENGLMVVWKMASRCQIWADGGVENGIEMPD